MTRLRALAFLAVLVVLGTAARGEEAQPGDAAKFLKENGLEGVHATCMDFISAMIAGKPGTATEIFGKFVLPSLKEESRKNSLELATRISSGLAGAGYVIADVELLGYRKISGKAFTLIYVLNTNRGPVLTALGVQRYQDAWYSYHWGFDGNPDKYGERLIGVVQFSKSIVMPIHRDEKKVQDEKPTEANDAATKTSTKG